MPITGKTMSNFVGANLVFALFIWGGGSDGVGVVVWCGWDFCVRSNRKNRDSAEEGFQTKIAAYDHPERRLIQTRSPNRPRLSPLATIAERRGNFLWRLLDVFVYLFEFGIVSV